MVPADLPRQPAPSRRDAAGRATSTSTSSAYPSRTPSTATRSRWCATLAATSRVSLFMASTRDGPTARGAGGRRQPDHLPRLPAHRVGGAAQPRREVIAKMNPVDYWAKFHADWAGQPNVVSVVHYRAPARGPERGDPRGAAQLRLPRGRARAIEIQLDFRPPLAGRPEHPERLPAQDHRQLAAHLQRRGRGLLRGARAHLRALGYVDTTTATVRTRQPRPRLSRRARRRRSPRRRSRRGVCGPRSTRSRARTSGAPSPSSG